MSAQIINRNEDGFTVQITVPYNRSMLDFEETLQQQTQCRRCLGHPRRASTVRHRRLADHRRVDQAHQQGTTPQGLPDPLWHGYR